MADPMTAFSIGSSILGNAAEAKQKAAMEAQANAAKLANFRIQQNKEAMASDRQNEKLMDQLYNVARSNEMIEHQSMLELFGNAGELQRQGLVARNDLATKSREVQEANQISAMSRGIDGTALDSRIKKLNDQQLIKSNEDLTIQQTQQQDNLLQRRSGQLASRQSEAIAGNTWQPGRAPDLYDNSSSFMAGAMFKTFGTIAGGLSGFKKFGGE